MKAEEWQLDTLARRIAEADPAGPVPEAAAELTRMHRELTAALGPDQARIRFDAALARALAPDRPGDGSRLSVVAAPAAA